MKFRNVLLTAASACGLFLAVQTGFAQGPLTPPGPPAPTMKTLDQVEPRTIVNSANTPGDAGDLFVISKPGSYYLTCNITGVSGQNGIEIAANNVTLDLNGFSLCGAPGAGNAVDLLNTVENIAVRNGSVSGWGQGLVSWSYLSQNIVFEHLNVASNLGDGIVLNAPGEILNCTSQANGGDGIDFNGGVVSDCTALTNGGYGINGAFEVLGNNDATDPLGASDSQTITGCTADYNGFDGIDCVNGNVSQCAAWLDGGSGIYAVDSVVSACSAILNAEAGIESSQSTISGCSAEGSATGISAYQSAVSGCCMQFNVQGVNAEQSTVSGCTVTIPQQTSDYGIYAMGGGNSITGNTCVSYPYTVRKGAPPPMNPPTAAIYIAGSTNYIDGNRVLGVYVAGIEVGAANTANVITKNSVAGAGANNYVVPAGNDLGPVGTAATSTSPWANISH